MIWYNKLASIYEHLNHSDGFRNLGKTAEKLTPSSLSTNRCLDEQKKDAIIKSSVLTDIGIPCTVKSL